MHTTAKWNSILSVLVMIPMIFTNLNHEERVPAVNNPAAGKADHVPGVILVGLKTGITLEDGLPDENGRFKTNGKSLGDKLKTLNVHKADGLFPATSSQKDPTTISTEQVILNQVHRLHLPVKANLQAAIQTLQADPDVEFAEPDFIAIPADIVVQSDNPASVNDPLYAEQWGLAKINIETAWGVTSGSPATIIAIVDSGIDQTHVDLAAHLWVNPGEIANNGIDDDNNGYVDDVKGWNFVSGTKDVSDDNGHGTLVAGVAAAIANNSQGIAGVCPECTIMPVKVMQPSGVANYSDIAAGVLYAALKGARVINLSLGGYSDSNTLHNAINTAVNTFGAVVVAGAGNDNLNQSFYPAAYDHVLGVAGSAADDTKLDFSNYGSWVDVSAPAKDIRTTALGGDWANGSGTSVAAPFASGLVGLVLTQHPDWNQATIRSQIAHTTDSIGSMNPSYAGLLGSGRLNAGTALQAPHPLLSLAGSLVNGQADGRPLLGATASLNLTLQNDWWDALGVTGTLTTADSYVTVVNGSTSFGDIPAGTSVTNSTAFTFTVDSGAGYNHSIPFTLNVNDTGGYSNTFDFTLSTESGVENKSGTIPSDETWTSDKTYLFTNNVNIPVGVTLTIQPGTIVKFNGNYNLNVRGSLLADGSPDKPIVFKDAASNTWGYILFDDTSTDASADSDGNYLSGSILRYVNIESSSGGVDCTTATPYLSHLSLQGGGVACSLGVTPIWLLDSSINGGAGFTGSGSALRNTISGNLDISGAGTATENTITGSLTLGSGTANGNKTGGNLSVGGSGGSITDNTVSGANVGAGSSFSVLRNTISGGLNAGDGSIVDHNTLTGGGIAAGNSAVVTWNNVEGASNAGLAAGSNVTAQYNRLVGNGTGMTASTGLIEHNLVANNSGVGLMVGAATVRYNTLTGNAGNTILVQGGNPLTLESNNLEGNTGTYDLYVNIPAGVFIFAQHNWWGSTDNLVIAGRIYDWNDDDTKATASYTLKLTEPDQTAPAYVRGVTVLPDSTLGIQTGTFQVNFSKPMDTNKNPLISFHDTRRGQTFGYPIPIGDIYYKYNWEPIAFMIAQGEKVFIGSSIWWPFNCIIKGSTSHGSGFGFLDQEGNWTTLLNESFITGNKDMFGNIFIADLSDNLHYSTQIVELDSNGGWHSYNMPVSYFIVNSIKFDTDGNLYIFDCNTAAQFVLSPSGTFVPFSGEPLSGAWWTPTIPNNVDQFGNIWNFKTNGDWGVNKYFIGYDYLVENGFNWSSSLIHQSTFDITSLVPKATYILPISGARDVDGMLLAPNSNTTFQVDYAGFISDKTPPTQPVVTANGNSTLTTISASWSSSDPESSITQYRYAIGTTPGGREVLDWIYLTSTSMTKTGLNLANGLTAYVSVAARNEGGLWSTSGVSKGLKAAPAPANLNASDGTFTDKVHLTWSALSGSTSYKVYRATSLSGAKSLLGSPITTSFDDITTTAGITYTYWVRACKAADCGGFSTANTGWRSLPAPLNLQASDGTYTSKALLTWDAVSGAGSYRVYRATSWTGTKSLLGSPTTATFADTTSTPGITYTYWVTACKTGNCSKFSLSNTGWRNLSTPANLRASDGGYTDRVQLNWYLSTGATSYKVLRATSSTGTKVLLSSPTVNSYADNTATPGVTYTYWVRACKDTRCSDFSLENTGWRNLTAPASLQASDGTYTDKVQLTWAVSTEATSYNVYRADTWGGTKTLLGSPSVTTFDDSTATAGVTYYYWVKACRDARCSNFSIYNTGWRAP